MNRIYAGKWYFYPDRKRPVLITTTGSDITTTGSDFSWGCYVDEEGKERSVPADYLDPMPWDEWYVWPGEDKAEPWRDVSWHDLAVLGEGVISPVTAYNRWSELAQGKQYERALREVQAWLKDVDPAVRRSFSDREIRAMCRDHFREFAAPAETLQQLTAAIYNLLPQCPENTVHVYDGVDPATVDIVVRTDEIDALEINDVLCDVGIMGIRYRIWDVDAVCDHLSIYGDVSVCRGCGNVTFMVRKGLLQMRAGYAVQEDRQHWYASLDKVTDNPHFTGRTLEDAVDQAMAKFVELVVDSLPGA